jgi:phytoene dehydrogenase-like protein
LISFREQRRDVFGNAAIDTLSEFIPDLKDIIFHKQVLTPRDRSIEFEKCDRGASISQGLPRAHGLP